MNERIREFAEQAKKYSIDKLDETGELHKYYDVYFEKFAELIVQECSKIVLNCGIPGSNNERDFIVASREIKHHFGVEECEI